MGAPSNVPTAQMSWFKVATLWFKVAQSKAAEDGGRMPWGQAVHTALRLQPGLLLVSISTIVPMASIGVGCWGKRSCGYWALQSCSSVLTWAALQELPQASLSLHAFKKHSPTCLFTSGCVGFSPFFNASTNASNTTAGMWQKMRERRVFKWLGTRQQAH